VSAEAQARASTANAEAQRLAALQFEVFRDLTLIVDDDPLLYLQFAQAAEGAQDYASAVTAYERFLELSPNNPNAEQIRERIDALEAIGGQTSGSGDEAAGGGSNPDSDGE
jgi:regulator of sirC expression with transglutaminase-like and TPR domain